MRWRPRLGGDQPAVVDAAYDVLTERGRWPTFRELDRTLYRPDGPDLRSLTPRYIALGSPLHLLHLDDDRELP